MADEKINKQNVEEPKDNEVVEEKDVKKDNKKFFLSKFYTKILIYTSSFLVFILLTIFISMIVYDLKASNDFALFDQKVYYPAEAPRDVYKIPKFKLALDRVEGENLTTIVQVELVLAYEKGNQQVLTEIIQRKDQIRDKLQYIIAKKNYDNISTAFSREEILKKDLLNVINSIMHGRILDIYFNAFMISRVP